MESKSRFELAVKIIAPFTMLIGILIGVWQFNVGQRNLQQKELDQRKFELEKMLIGNQFEAIAKFKEIQSVKYKEATETISNIIYTDNYQSVEFKESLKRFWQLYWVELSAVEDKQVESAMVPLGNFIKKLQKQNFENLTHEDKTKLSELGLKVAQAIKKSSKEWQLPEGFDK
jgi:hypothetical protein